MSDLDEFNEICDSMTETETSTKSIPTDIEPAARAKSVTNNSDSDSSPTVKNLQMWAVSGDNYIPCESTVEILLPGQYIIRHSEQQGIFFVKKDVNLDDLLILPDNNSEKVLKSIASFWTREEEFRRFGFLWKRGIMLWGPPGSGKTSTVQLLSKQIVDAGGISLYSTCPELDAMGLSILRKIEPHRKIVVIIEDIDAVVHRHGESDVLAMLDGELQVDNVVFVATTNYPERLDKRLVNRPSRFDEIIKIGMPNDACRKMYLSVKNPRLTEKELTEWVGYTKDFSIAHLKELIVSVECLGNDVDTSVNRIQKMNKANPSSLKNDHKFGFTNN